MYLLSRGMDEFKSWGFLGFLGFLVSGFSGFWFLVSGFWFLVSGTSGFYFRMCWRFSSQKHPENKSWARPATSLPLDEPKMYQRFCARGLILNPSSSTETVAIFVAARGVPRVI